MAHRNRERRAAKKARDAAKENEIYESEFECQQKQRFLSCLSKNIEVCPGTQPASLLIGAICSCYQPLGREVCSDAHLGQG